LGHCFLGQSISEAIRGTKRQHREPHALSHDVGDRRRRHSTLVPILGLSGRADGEKPVPAFVDCFDEPRHIGLVA
jgi:hypothetical protein